jgi:hypothetical protein
MDKLNYTIAQSVLEQLPALLNKTIAAIGLDTVKYKYDPANDVNIIAQKVYLFQEDKGGQPCNPLIISFEPIPWNGSWIPAKPVFEFQTLQVQPIMEQNSLIIQSLTFHPFSPRVLKEIRIYGTDYEVLRETSIEGSNGVSTYIPLSIRTDTMINFHFDNDAILYCWQFIGHEICEGVIISHTHDPTRHEYMIENVGNFEGERYYNLIHVIK